MAGASLAGGLLSKKSGDKVAAASDPFAPYRPGYAAKLQELEANPGLLTRRPGYQAGLDAIERTMGSRGYLGSGNIAASMFRYGGQFYNEEANRLATLAGAGQTPGAGQATSAGLYQSALGQTGYGIGELMRQYQNANAGNTGGGWAPAPIDYSLPSQGINLGQSIPSSGSIYEF
jgi:hypothetical protein